LIREHEIESVPGLPGPLPQGERLLWQGRPDWRRLARSGFHVPLVAAYFAVLASWDAIAAARGDGGWSGVAIVLASGLACVGVLTLIAWASARATVYSLTDRRLVIRGGIALSVCVNVPLALVESVDLRLWRDGVGDIPVTLGGTQRIGWVALWPHVRPWRLTAPQPMLRAVPDAANVAGLIARTTGVAQGTPVDSVPRLAVAA
jgi:hypothetical protein